MSRSGPIRALLCCTVVLSVCNAAPQLYCRIPSYTPTGPTDPIAAFPVCDGTPGYVQISGGGSSSVAASSGGAMSGSAGGGSGSQLVQADIQYSNTVIRGGSMEMAVEEYHMSLAILEEEEVHNSLEQVEAQEVHLARVLEEAHSREEVEVQLGRVLVEARFLEVHLVRVLEVVEDHFLEELEAHSARILEEAHSLEEVEAHLGRVLEEEAHFLEEAVAHLGRILEEEAHFLEEVVAHLARILEEAHSLEEVEAHLGRILEAAHFLEEVEGRLGRTQEEAHFLEEVEAHLGNILEEARFPEEVWVLDRLFMVVVSVALEALLALAPDPAAVQQSLLSYHLIKDQTMVEVLEELVVVEELAADFHRSHKAMDLVVELVEDQQIKEQEEEEVSPKSSNPKVKVLYRNKFSSRG
ncbi:unnamed protein product, partial [Ranitomeya imitator]